MIGFAHRGAPPAGVRDNTLAAFNRALEHGAKALESDVWLTADGVPVLIHDGYLRQGLRRRFIATTPFAELPGWLPSMAALYESTDTTFELCLDVKHSPAAPPAVEVARAHGADSRLWICGNVDQVREWTKLPGRAKPAVSTTLRSNRQTKPERIDEAAAAGAVALNLRAREWTPHFVQRCHELGMKAFAWDVQQRQTLATMRSYGCDAIFSDFLTLLAAA